MEKVPDSVRGINFCSGYYVFCDGQKHVVLLGPDGVPIDSAPQVARSLSDVIVVDEPVNCTRMHCHGRDASGVIAQQVSEWMRNAE